MPRRITILIDNGWTVLTSLLTLLLCPRLPGLWFKFTATSFLLAALLRPSLRIRAAFLATICSIALNASITHEPDNNIVLLHHHMHARTPMKELVLIEWNNNAYRALVSQKASTTYYIQVYVSAGCCCDCKATHTSQDWMYPNALDTNEQHVYFQQACLLSTMWC